MRRTVPGGYVADGTTLAGAPTARVDIPPLVPDMVDSAVSCLLGAIDEGLLELDWEDERGARVDLTTEGEGEMCGWYMGSESWRSMYARERYVDYFADVRGFFDSEGTESGPEGETK